MYQLPDYFKPILDNTKTSDEMVFKGEKYRITVLSDCLFRLEYNPSGIFNDNLTEIVKNRNFEKPIFDATLDKGILNITTKYAKLSYIENRSFVGSKINPADNLSVDIISMDRTWYYGKPEIRNVNSPSGKNNIKNNSYSLKKSLFSYDGYSTIDDSKSLVITSDGSFKENENKGIDLYLFVYGNDFSECLKSYFKLTGFTPLIPRYALGNWWYKNETYNDYKLKSLVDNFKNKQIPLSVILLNKDWHISKFGDKEYTSGFTFNSELYASPKDMITYLHNLGIRIGLTINPNDGFLPYDEYYKKATEYIKPDETGIIPFNVYDNKVVDIFFKLFIHPLDALGVDFYYLNSDINKKSDIINHYQSLDMNRNDIKRQMVYTNSPVNNQHKYILSPGESIVGWEHLRRIPFYNSLSVNNGVMWWSHDIGGFKNGIENDELYIRYLQLGTFSPILRLSSDIGEYYKRTPWKWNIKTYTIAKQYLTLRHRLVPYLYSEAYKYSTFGELFIKPLYYTYQELFDDDWYKNEYYLGSQLFIAPIITTREDVMQRVIHKFYIPDGTWYDFTSGKKFVGPNTYVSFFKDEDYPVFAKSGSIIIMGQNDNINDLTPPKNIDVHIFPGTSNSYDLYEDDGYTNLYKKGYFLKTKIEYNYMPSNYTVIVRSIEGKSNIVPDTRNYRFVFRNTKQADDVIIYYNNMPMPYNSYTSGNDFIVEVNDISTIGQLTLNCKGKDIEIAAERVINNDIKEIISDLEIETDLKERVDKILFSDYTYKKKSLEITKLGRRGLDGKFIRMFKNLLDYVDKN